MAFESIDITTGPCYAYRDGHITPTNAYHEMAYRKDGGTYHGPFMKKQHAMAAFLTKAMEYYPATPVICHAAIDGAALTILHKNPQTGVMVELLIGAVGPAPRRVLQDTAYEFFLVPPGHITDTKD